MATSLSLKLKTLDNKTHDVETTKETDVLEFKRKVEEVTGVAFSQQRIIFRGRVLKDDKKMKDYPLEDGNVLHLVVRDAPPAGSSRNAPATPSPAAPAPSGQQPRIHVQHFNFATPQGQQQQGQGQPSGPSPANVHVHVAQVHGPPPTGPAGGPGAAAAPAPGASPAAPARPQSPWTSTSRVLQTMRTHLATYENYRPPPAPQASGEQEAQVPAGPAPAAPTPASIPEPPNPASNPFSDLGRMTRYLLDVQTQIMSHLRYLSEQFDNEQSLRGADRQVLSERSQRFSPVLHMYATGLRDLAAGLQHLNLGTEPGQFTIRFPNHPIPVPLPPGMPATGTPGVPAGGQPAGGVTQNQPGNDGQGQAQQGGNPAQGLEANIANIFNSLVGGNADPNQLGQNVMGMVGPLLQNLGGTFQGQAQQQPNAAQAQNQQPQGQGEGQNESQAANMPAVPEMVGRMASMLGQMTQVARSAAAADQTNQSQGEDVSGADASGASPRPELNNENIISLTSGMFTNIVQNAASGNASGMSLQDMMGSLQPQIPEGETPTFFDQLQGAVMENLNFGEIMAVMQGADYQPLQKLRDPIAKAMLEDAEKNSLGDGLPCKGCHKCDKCIADITAMIAMQMVEPLAADTVDDETLANLLGETEAEKRVTARNLCACAFTLIHRHIWNIALNAINPEEATEENPFPFALLLRKEFAALRIQTFPAILTHFRNGDTALSNLLMQLLGVTGSNPSFQVIRSVIGGNIFQSIFAPVTGSERERLTELMGHRPMVPPEDYEYPFDVDEADVAPKVDSSVEKQAEKSPEKQAAKEDGVDLDDLLDAALEEIEVEPEGEAAPSNEAWSRKLSPKERQWIVETMAKDDHIQENAGPQKPFSDAYLRGLPKVKRPFKSLTKVMTSSGSALHQVVTEASKKTRGSVDTDAVLEKSNAAGMTSLYDQRLGDDLKFVVENHPGYDPSKYPSIAKHLMNGEGGSSK